MNKYRSAKALPPVRMSERELLKASLVCFECSAILVVFVVFFLNPLMEALGL